MMSRSDTHDPDELFDRTLEHLASVNKDPNATWLDQERALAAALEVAVLAGTANAAPTHTDPAKEVDDA